jgi:predicted MPP superfamily phosphohydrolase
MALSRRRFIHLSLASTALVGLYTWRIEPHWVEFVRRPLPIAGLPRDLAGRTLAQVSDLHIGPRVDDDYLRETFAAVARLRPDFVVMTGDFVSYRDAAQFAQMGHVIDAFPQGRLGTFAILGNHDYGRAWSELGVADQVAGVAAKAGITVLRNETRVVRGLQIVGLDDFWSPRFDPKPVLSGRDRTAATIVLSHNPDAVDAEEAWAGYDGWILGGHTHGGQCKPPFLPPPLVPVRNKRYTAGAFALSGGRTLYINRGLGHLLRVRFNVRPEVTLFELARA